MFIFRKIKIFEKLFAALLYYLKNPLQEKGNENNFFKIPKNVS